MEVLNQPSNTNIGKQLEIILNDRNRRFKTFYLITAYVKSTGVLRLKPYLEQFKSSGGCIKAVVGIDQRNTSIQGLKELLPLCNKIWVYHNENPVQTFHPKAYAFEQPNKKAELFIGSSNFTYGGLYTNNEMNAHFGYDLSNPSNAKKFREFKSAFTEYSTISDFCKRLTPNLLKKLTKKKYLSDEKVLMRRLFSSSVRRSTGIRIFGSKTFKAPSIRVISEDEEQDAEISGITPIAQGFWKRLARFDVSLSSAPGQMVIPIRFLGFFPAFTIWQVRPNGARQSENFFNVIFVKTSGKKLRIDNVRAIEYAPAPRHPRQNREIRFTFLNRTILTSLSKGDILEFRLTNNPDVRFIIRHITSTSPDYRRFSGRYGFI